MIIIINWALITHTFTAFTYFIQKISVLIPGLRVYSRYLLNVNKKCLGVPTISASGINQEGIRFLQKKTYQGYTGIASIKKDHFYFLKSIQSGSPLNRFTRHVRYKKLR
jgi:hypothetical protein